MGRLQGGWGGEARPVRTTVLYRGAFCPGETCTQWKSAGSPLASSPLIPKLHIMEFYARGQNSFFISRLPTELSAAPPSRKRNPQPAPPPTPHSPAARGEGGAGGVRVSESKVQVRRLRFHTPKPQGGGGGQGRAKEKLGGNLLPSHPAGRAAGKSIRRRSPCGSIPQARAARAAAAGQW